ncbi:hypothetical protein AM593_09375, partial [Mytilus galloprovincialis]
MVAERDTLAKNKRNRDKKLQETKKHLRIASDQIHGLKERIGSLEDENSKLKNSFWENQPTLEDDDRTLSGSIDTVLSVGTPSGSIDTVLSVGSSERLHEDVGDSDEYIDTIVENEASEKEDIEYFRKRVASLEARLEEVCGVTSRVGSVRSNEHSCPVQYSGLR